MEKLSRQRRRLLERKPWLNNITRYKFAGPTHTYQIPRFELDENGNPIYSENLRTKFKKAYNAFLKGKMLYKYKNQFRVVPKIPINQIDKSEEE